MRGSHPSVLIGFLLAACGDGGLPSGTPTDVMPLPTTSEAAPIASPAPERAGLVRPPELTIDQVPFTCASHLAFGVEALGAPRGAEEADHPVARRLRGLLADGSVPDRPGWQLVAFSREGALFLLPAAPTDGSQFWNVEFEYAGGAWEPIRFGQCDIQPAFEGAEAASWELAPGEDPNSDTTRFDVLVTERACASGASPEGRIIGPAIVQREDAVVVIIATRPPAGPQTCQPGPPAQLRVVLPDRLGDRQLFDGFTYPPEPRG